MIKSLDSFQEIWLADYEFQALLGGKPLPICMVAHELKKGHRIKVWQDRLLSLCTPPYSIGPNSLFIAYYSSAEFSCHFALDWELPQNVLDLYVEFRNLTNGCPIPSGSGLLGALIKYGIRKFDAIEKDEMRNLAIRGGPFTSDEQKSLLDYCESDVEALSLLFEKMEPELDLERALLRGESMKAVAAMEHTGVPIDMELFPRLKNNWASIKQKTVDQIDSQYGIYEGTSFKTKRFENYLQAENIPWPRLESGALELKESTFKHMSQTYPQLTALKDLRWTLSQMKLSELAVGPDGRNRCLLSPFRAKTGRNQPSTSKFIYGTAAWLRGLIKPEAGYGLAYIDFEQQEFGVAAALSKDNAMMAAYNSGDPYLAFAKQANAVPPEATKKTHGLIRDQYKACVLAVQYGMGEHSMALRINQPIAKARELLNVHHETYRSFWKWSDSVVNCALLKGEIWTVFGWYLYMSHAVNPRSVRNFPMQANGAEILRLACCMLVEAGVQICAPIHDALLIEAPIDQLEEKVQLSQKLMEDASEVILNGFRLRTDVESIKYPDRYQDKRGIKMWNTVMDILDAS